MKSLRLNKEMRENILNNFVAKYLEANPKPESTLSKNKIQSDIANKIHQKVYANVVALNIPDEFVNTSSYVAVQLPNESVSHWVYRDNEGNSVYKVSTKLSKVEYVFTESDPLWLEYKELDAQLKEQSKVFEQHSKDLGKFKAEVKQVLDSVNTTGQLVEVWPEAAPFVPQEISNPSSINLPAVNFAELNKVIG